MISQASDVSGLIVDQVNRCYNIVVLGSKQPPCIFAGVRLASVTPSPEPHSSGSRLALGLPFFFILRKKIIVKSELETVLMV